MRAEQEGKETEQEALRTAVMVERERVASKKDMEFWEMGSVLGVGFKRGGQRFVGRDVLGGGG